jgi:hypothetical protein
MKFKNFCILVYVIFLISCGSESPKKIDLKTEQFNASTYKATIEQAYADSPNKKNQEILLNFIDDNIQGKIDMHSLFSILEKNGNIKESVRSNVDYANILDVFAIPYWDWKKKFTDFNTKLNNTLDIKLIDILKDYDKRKVKPQFEIQNKGDIDIVSISFYLSMTNKSGEELYFQNFEYTDKIGKGSAKKSTLYSSEIEQVANMDLSQITKNFTVTKVSFIDGTTLIRPKENLY